MERDLDDTVIRQPQIGREAFGDPGATRMDTGDGPLPARAAGLGGQHGFHVVAQRAVERFGVGGGSRGHSGYWSKYCCRMMRAASASSAPGRAPAIWASCEV